MPLPVRLLLLLSLAACQAADVPAAQDSTALGPMLERRADGAIIASAESLRKIPGYVVDSIFPPEEALRRFREAAGPDRPAELSAGDTSVRALLSGYVAALRARDSIAVLRYALTRAEYAWLYFDGSPDQRAGLVPQVAWALTESRSNVGLGRAASRVASLGETKVVAASCGARIARLPEAELFGPCTVDLVNAAGDTTRIPVATSAMRRHGRIKLVSFANDL